MGATRLESTGDGHSQSVKNDQAYLTPLQHTAESTIHSSPKECNTSQNHQLDFKYNTRKVLFCE